MGQQHPKRRQCRACPQHPGARSPWSEGQRPRAQRHSHARRKGSLLPSVVLSVSFLGHIHTELPSHTPQPHLCIHSQIYNGVDLP